MTDDRKAWNSTLRPGGPLKRGQLQRGTKRLKARTLTERTEGDPTRYGPLWKRVREYPCLGSVHLKGWHTCALGYAPGSAHHFGDTDLDGMAPACGRLHDALETVRGVAAVERELRIRGRSLPGLVRGYMETAASALYAEDPEGFPPELAPALPPDHSAAPPRPRKARALLRLRNALKRAAGVFRPPDIREGLQ